MKLFSSIISSTDLEKVNFVVNYNTKLTSSNTDELIKAISKEIFITEDFKFNLPTFKWSATKRCQKLIDSHIIDENILYNKPKYIRFTSNKELFYKLFKNFDFLPKTTFLFKKALKLNFPIIVKPKNSYAGKGIKRYETLEEFKTDNTKHDIYQECIRIEDEYRAVYFKGRPIFISLRKPLNEKAISIRNGGSQDFDKKEKIKFKWVPQNLENFPYLEDFSKICKVVYKGTKLEIIGVDIAVDVNAKSWLIEANTSFGLNNDQIILIYEEIYKDFYDCEVNNETKEYFKGLKQLILTIQESLKDLISALYML